MSRRIAVSKIFTAVLLGVTVGLSAQSSQPAAPAAEAILAPAFTRAAKEGKNVLIDFGARTWCVPCFKLRTFLSAPEIAPIVEAHFVVVELTVWESKGNLHLNNAGTEVLMQQWGPVGGIPFVALADANRRVLATSVTAGFGGYPADPSEIEAFAKFLSTAAPRMTPGERTKLTNWLSTRADKFGSVAGRVLGRDGQPLVKAVVSLVERVYADGRWRPVQKQTVTTDVAGRYALERVSPGSYRVMVDAPPIAAATAAGLSTAAATFFPSITRFAEATDVVVVAGQDLLDLDVTLLLTSPRRVAGLALGADRRALSGAVVSLTNMDWPATSYTATTLADGAFSVAAVRPGQYQVWVQSAAVGAQPREIGSASVDLLRSDVLDLRIASSVGATLSGILTIEGGTVPPEDRAAIRVAAIALEPAPGAPGILRQAPVDGAGRFDVRGLFGKRIVRVSNLPAGWVLGSVHRDGVDITDRAIEIGNEARDVHNLEIVLRRGAQISGTLADSAGQPGKTGAVIVFAADALRWTYPSRFLKNAPVQNDGTFAVRGLPSGRYLLAYVASLSSDWDSLETLESLRLRATPVEVGDREDRRLNIVTKGDSAPAITQQPARAQAPAPVKWTIALAPSTKDPVGAAFSVMLKAKIEPGWHLYALAQPPGGPIPLAIDMPKGPVFSRAGAVVEPTPRKSIDANFNGLMTLYFEESAAFTVPVRVATGTKPGRHQLQVTVEHQLCKAQVCLPPTTVELTLEVSVGPVFSDEPGLDEDEATAFSAQRGAAARPDADTLLASALTEAQGTKKIVWVDFSASWCGPCLRILQFLDAPAMRPILSKHFVIVPLTAGETGDRAALDHPGALALKARLGGGIGLPFYVFLDASGKTLTSFDSVPFPARGSTKDATAFVDQLARLASRMTPAERSALVGFLAKP